MKTSNLVVPTLLLLSFASGAGPALAQPVDVLPLRITDGAQSLNGTWKFKYIPSSSIGNDESFFQSSFNVAGWKNIPVPSHWELQGFTDPQYGDDVKEGTGLYRRTFRLPKLSNGERVFLRFEGVLYGLTAWVNGKPIGEWASSYNPVTFDITDALMRGDADNILAVRVSTRSKGWNFDNMDSWSLSGIFRDVTLFALPQAHFKDYTETTTLRPDGTANVHLEVQASTSGGVVAGQLIAPDGRTVKQFAVPVSATGHASTDVIVSQPQLWTAETPSLYRLELTLQSAGKTVQRYTARIGLRQISTENGIFKLNGTPIKLRGVNHHDLWPEGQVATEANMRRDLELIRAANINFIRTSHYPPHPRLLELCDEMGIYVDDEVPYIHGRKNLTDPAYQDSLLTRARATVMRDKNHPSVLLWSLGNENPITELGNNTGKYVKELDPSRPFTFPTQGPYFAKEWQNFPQNMEVYAPHYPTVKEAWDYAQKLQRPIIFTEYAHQRGLARGGTAVQNLWDEFYKQPRIAGGAIWVFQDQGLLRTATDRKSVKDQEFMVWLDDHHYYDTRGFYAMDGIVYADRTPQVDYWQVRKVYSPVQIPEGTLSIKPGTQQLSFKVENRFDFRSLSGIKLNWTLRRNGADLQSGVVALSARAKDTEVVSVNANLPANLSTDLFALELRCQDEQGQQFYERTIRLDSAPEDARWSALNAALPVAEPKLDISDSTITVRLPTYQLNLDRKSGQLSLVNPAGVTLASNFGPHMGRNPTINDVAKNREREPMLWTGKLMHDATNLQTDARKGPGGIELSVNGTYTRSNKPDEFIRGGYKLLIEQNGSIEVSYDYTPINATGEVLEAGFALQLPKQQSEFRWVGQGPYAGYPGKDRLNEYGIYHLNREDLYFPGNRRGVEFTSLTDANGIGLLLAGTSMTIDTEKVEDGTVLSHLALVPGERSTNDGKGENVDVSSRLKAPSIKSINGKFKLLPLGDTASQLVSTWLGAPDVKVPIVKPFLYSYDQ